MSGMLWCSNFKLTLLPLIRCLDLLDRLDVAAIAFSSTFVMLSTASR